MTYHEFVAEVKAMREAQKSYFQARRGGRPADAALEESKVRDRYVDTLIRQFEAPPGLFDKEA